MLACLLVLASCGDGRHTLQWGVFLPDDGSASSDIETVAMMAGDEPDLVMVFAAIDEPVPIDRLEQITGAGRAVMLTLEPWIPGDGVSQPKYSLKRIAAGAHDAALSRWARQLAAWDRPLQLRFAHEMNGTWYPWAVGVNGNDAQDYVAAWNHVHAIFRAAGADQVDFVWAPNAAFEGSSNLEDAYPGPEVVDLLGVDGYNWASGDGFTWQGPEEIFGETLERLRALDGGLPILVAETASAEGPVLGADKAAWIRDAVDYFSRSDRVVGFIWFQAVKERDWRFNSTAEAQAAMKDALAQLPS